MIEEKIKEKIRDALKELGVDTKDISLEHPADLSHGDFSTNVALAYCKELKMKPRELAEKIQERLNLSADLRFSLERIEVAGAGFINFYLKPEFFQSRVLEIGKNEKYGRNESLARKKIMVEYTDPNPFKEFHIGHLMSNAIGEAISRTLDFCGAKIKRASWQGDVGLHVAKAIFGALKNGMPKTISEWGRGYADGATAFEESEEAKKEIIEINTKVYERTDEKINELYDSGRKMSLEHFEEIYLKLDTKFDYYFFEGKEGRDGEKIVREFLNKGIFEESESAIVFKGEEYGLHTRVFINSKGLPTYEAKELGLNKQKFEVEPDLSESIIVTANEQNDYFKVLLKVLTLIYPNIGEKTKHIGHGMLRFADGKMGSRKGNVITGENLISQVEELVKEKIKARDFSETEKSEIAQSVSIGAIKYSILKQAVGGDIIYDFEKSISFEGDSGPYLQYSYVRAKSILEKAGPKNLDIEIADFPKEVSTLEKLLCRFPEVVLKSSELLSPHVIATYLIELSSAFNAYYAQNQIIDDKNPLSLYRLAITSAFVQTMKNGLWILGMSAPSKM